MRTCPKCKNSINNDHAKFCKKCGCKLEPIQTKENERNQYHSKIDKKVTMGKAIKICFSKYVKFEGKASRSEYWYFWLFSFCMGTIPVILAFIIDKEDISLSLLAVSLVYGIISFLPMLSVAIRRLHDVGKSGVYFLVSFIPLVGGLILLYFLCKKGTENFCKN